MTNVFSFQKSSPEIDTTCFIAPTAAVIGQAKIGSNSSIWFQTVIRADINSISIGKNSNIQDGCILHVTHEHPVVVEDNVTVGHGVILHGCHVQSNCLIGMGSTILDGAVIGEGSLIAAGALVSPNTIIPPNSLVMGLPAKVVREVRPQDKIRQEISSQNYIGYARAYKQQFQSIE
jgi:carbonic anhydrase/acetyltransferase-like protein (isoleucine patch superfamily)